VLDGSGSFDPDSEDPSSAGIAAYEWFEDLGSRTPTLLGSAVTIDTLPPLGAHQIALRVSDRQGLTGVDVMEVWVVDTTPPSITVELSPAVQWPRGRL
jgi:hypothetical protein